MWPQKTKQTSDDINFSILKKGIVIEGEKIIETS